MGECGPRAVYCAVVKRLFVTGFPGFLATRLVRRLAPTAEEITLLVEKRFAEVAAERVAELEEDLDAAGRFTVAIGDITQVRLGLSEADYARVVAECDTVFHLAAIYDLAVPEELAQRVNVDGTRHVNDLVRSLQGLERYNYISTFAVAGRREGIVRENELEHEAGFHNFYESTKYEAEVAVRELVEDELPVSIFRPAVVVGSSKDGATAKFDGPYMMLRVLRRLPWPLGRLNFGSPAVRFQMVPVDFIVDSVSTISGREDAAGKTFHLTDPDPYTTAEIFDLLAEALHGKSTIARMPAFLVRATTATGALTPLGLQREAGAYFFHAARFDCVNTLDALDGSGVECPRLADYADRMVAYYLAHADAA